MTDTHARPHPAQGFTVLLPAQDRVLVGRPAADAVLAEAERLGARRVFLVTGRSLGGLDDGPVQRIEAALGERLAGRYSAIRAHSPREDVVAAANAARAAGADLLVAIGGGSAIDATKAVTMCLWCGIEQPADMESFRVAQGRAARLIVAPPEPIRMVAVSTTLSAADFSAGAGVTDTATNTKQSFSHPLLVPVSAVLDPEATLHTPRRLLLGTGIRAIDHAIESYCSTTANPITEIASLEGARRLARALPAIARDPASLAARQDAQLGMWQAGAACAAGAVTGASHGIGYALGATFGIPHGETSCVLLPAVLRWNASVNADLQAVLSEAMGQSGRAAGDVVQDLVRGLGLPATLKDLDIAPASFAAIAERSLAYAPVKANPRPIRSASDVMEILALAAG